jgi:diacylglycerol kinase
MARSILERQKETPNDRSWRAKIAHALRGVKAAIPQEKSFRLHFGGGIVTLVAAGLLRMQQPWQWSILLLCISSVVVAEMGNSALEEIGRGWGDDDDRHINTCLDIGAGMVLVAAIGAIAAGAVVFLHHIGHLLRYW